MNDSASYDPILALRRKGLIDAALRRLVLEASEDTEKKVLMPLWQTLGDRSATYFGAMEGIAGFVRMREEAGVLFQKLPLEVFIPVAKATAELLLSMVTSMVEQDTVREAIIRENPLPGDKE